MNVTVDAFFIIPSRENECELYVIFIYQYLDFIMGRRKSYVMLFNALFSFFILHVRWMKPTT